MFQTFKVVLRAYKDVWTLADKGRGGSNEDLAQWVFLAFKKALTTINICKRFFSHSDLAFESRCDGKQDATI
jgi:hypothetical protein